MTPPRHALGALLLEAGRVDDAEVVYLEDLKRHPENGWALQGLAECLGRQGKAAEAAVVGQRFAAAWKDATVGIGASCFCRRL
jgi:TolA-binding protein